MNLQKLIVFIVLMCNVITSYSIHYTKLYDDQLLVEGKPMRMERLTEATKEFIENPRNAENLPEKKATDVQFFGTVEVGKGVISLQNDRGTTYQTYLMVQNELQRAYTELRQDLAKKRFKKDYLDLDKDEQSAIREVYPQRISEAEPKNIGK